MEHGDASYEAHHIACVAAVTGIITTNQKIDKIVWNTQWCVNRENNMIALPLWPHTIEWYFQLGTRTLKQETVDGRAKPDCPQPPFADLAQHDYDHAEYIDEVNLSLDQVVRGVQQAVARKHEDPTGNLASQLDAVITKHKAHLQGRETHAAWEEGMNTPTGSWYKAFSMSQNSPSERAFPLPNNPLWQKMLETAAAFLKL